MASSSCVPRIHLLPGFKFLPTDQELLGYYLLNKVCGKPFKCDSRVMNEENLYKADPRDLWDKFGGKGLDQGEDLFFFTTLKKVNDTGSNVARTTGSGTWKCDTSGAKVYDSKDKKKVLGSWKRFHYMPNEQNENGSWIMLEYKLDDSLIPKSCTEDLVLCRIRKDRKRKSIEDQMNDTQQSSRKKLVRRSNNHHHVQQQQQQQPEVDSNKRFEEQELPQQESQLYVSPSSIQFHEQQQQLRGLASSDHYVSQRVETYEPMDVQPISHTVIGHQPNHFGTSAPFYYHDQQQELLGDDLMVSGHHYEEYYGSIGNVLSNPNTLVSNDQPNHLANSPLQDEIPFDDLFTVDELCGDQDLDNKAPSDSLFPSEPLAANFFCAANDNEEMRARVSDKAEGFTHEYYSNMVEPADDSTTMVSLSMLDDNAFSYTELDDNVLKEAYPEKTNEANIAAVVDENQFDDGSWLDDLIEDNNGSELF